MNIGNNLNPRRSRSGADESTRASTGSRSGSRHLSTRGSLFRGPHLSLIEMNGYDLLPDGQPTSKAILRVAKGKDVFTLKVLSYILQAN